MNGGMTGEVTREEDPAPFSVDDRHDDYVTSRDVSGVMLQGRHKSCLNFKHFMDVHAGLMDKERRAARAEVRRNRRAGGGRAFVKRDAPVTHTVELIIIADFEIYNR